jgi:hypothetical protein
MTVLNFILIVLLARFLVGLQCLYLALSDRRMSRKRPSLLGPKAVAEVKVSHTFQTVQDHNSLPFYPPAFPFSSLCLLTPSATTILPLYRTCP